MQSYSALHPPCVRGARGDHGLACLVRSVAAGSQKKTREEDRRHAWSADGNTEFPLSLRKQSLSSLFFLGGVGGDDGWAGPWAVPYSGGRWGREPARNRRAETRVGGL